MASVESEMAPKDIAPDFPQYDAPQKDLYEMGEVPPLGHVPAQMYAWAIRQERHGEPDTAMQLEVVDTPKLDSHEVLVYVMAAGVNYNGVWAALGVPISPFDGHKQPYHIAGSDAAGIIWAVGDKVTRWKIGDEVVVHCNQDDGDDEHCNGGDPMFSPSQRIWGYETPDGSFAQFTNVQAQQLMPRPKHLSWEEAACYTLTLATAYRMLFGHHPHELKPGQNVLVWGASEEDKRDFVMGLGAKGVINRKDFKCWGQLPTVNTPEYAEWFLMLERRLDPCMSEVFPWDDLPEAHMKMRRNEHKPGNMAVLVNSPLTGLRTFEDTLEASKPLK